MDLRQALPALLPAAIAWAEARGHTMGELAHAWLLAQPALSSVISGVTRVEQVHDNAKAADWLLTPAEAQEVTAILDGKDSA